MKYSCIIIFGILLSLSVYVKAASEEQITNSTTSARRLFAYAGPLLPNDWNVVTILNDRAVIGFSNGSARNSNMDQLDPRDKLFLEKLQNGTIYTTPLSSAKEKISQWSSSVSSTVTKFGKSVRDQLDGLINNKNKESPMNSTGTIIVQ